MKKGLIKIFELKNIISIKDLNKSDIDYIIDEASKLEDIAKSREISEELKGKILGLMFFEPSTRTKMSFEMTFYDLSSGRSHSYYSAFGSSVAVSSSSVSPLLKLIISAVSVAVVSPIEL